MKKRNTSVFAFTPTWGILSPSIDWNHYFTEEQQDPLTILLIFPPICCYGLNEWSLHILRIFWSSEFCTLKYNSLAIRLPSPRILLSLAYIQDWMLVRSSATAVVLNASSWDVSFAAGWMATLQMGEKTNPTWRSSESQRHVDHTQKINYLCHDKECFPPQTTSLVSERCILFSIRKAAGLMTKPAASLKDCLFLQ